MKYEMSNDLRAALAALLRWYEASGQDATRLFSKSKGICWNVYGYFRHNGMSFVDREGLKHELRRVFLHTTDPDDPVYPFGGEKEFVDRIHSHSFHECPVRLAWLKEVLS